jgi:antitoxin component of MazEF toxin-antitoxin module
MARQKSSTKNRRKLGKTGNVDSPSYYVTIPIEMIRELSWREGQKVVVSKQRNKIIIQEVSESA